MSRIDHDDQESNITNNNSTNCNTKGSVEINAVHPYIIHTTLHTVARQPGP